ncbi:MAG: hypothetical protein OEZ10_10080 [Gammaproteobacteria bacterium]|nr:hypothetical protein [Gammaproteobacteria bacterium]
MRAYSLFRYRVMNVIAMIVLAAFLSGCLFVPVSQEHHNPGCDLVTKR